jgi:pilus assembly protein CpaC
MRVLTRESRPAVAAFLTALALAATTSEAWAQPGAPDVGANENVYQVVAPRSELQIVEQFSRVFESPNRIVRVDGFDPDVITVSALSPHRIRVLGEKTGVTTLVITDEFDNAYSIEVFVAGDVRHLQAYLRQLFPEDDVQAVKLNDSIVLRGVVTEPGHITQIVDVALEFSTKVLNQLEVAGVHQVQLNVKVMEVARTKIRQLGINWFLKTPDTYVRSTPGNLQNIANLSTPFGGPPDFPFDPLTINNTAIQFAVMGTSEVFNGFVDALREENLLKILAEPTVVTTSGRPALILSGGEFPLPVAQGLGQVTLEWKDYGVRMEAVPIVLGNGRLRLDVSPEVSERDFTVAANVNGTLTPGIKTRRVNTQVEMRFGETLMLGGLISARKEGQTSKIPFLGELPWIGVAFRSVRYENTESELLIMVTPHMVAPLQPHQVPHLGPGQFTDDPTDRELFMDGMIEVPLYGPDCDGCGPMGAYGGYLEGGHGAGGYGAHGYGAGGYGAGGYCGDGCSPTTILHDGMMLPEGGYSPEGYTPVDGMPLERQHYQPAPPPALPEGSQPADPESVNFNASPKLPPLPGQTQSSTQPTGASNQPANLGLIDPFRRQVRTGQAPVEVKSQQIQASPTSHAGGHSTQTTGRSQTERNLAQTAIPTSSPWSR